MKNEIESSEFVENILNILSKLPPGLRTSIMKNRMDEFLSFDSVEKNEIILNIFFYYKKIDVNSLNNLIESWLLNLSRMPNDKICDILYHYLLILSLNPHILENLDNTIIKLLSGKLKCLSINSQSKLKSCLFEMIFSTPYPDNFRRIIPGDLLSVEK